MNSLRAVFWRFVTKCELCGVQDALPDCKLCQACGEAIVRLVAIRERNREHNRYEVERARQADVGKVEARGFSPSVA